MSLRELEGVCDRATVTVELEGGVRVRGRRLEDGRRQIAVWREPEPAPFGKRAAPAEPPSSEELERIADAAGLNVVERAAPRVGATRRACTLTEVRAPVPAAPWRPGRSWREGEPFEDGRLYHLADAAMLVTFMVRPEGVVWRLDGAGAGGTGAGGWSEFLNVARAVLCHTSNP